MSSKFTLLFSVFATFFATFAVYIIAGSFAVCQNGGDEIRNARSDRPH